MQIMVKNALVGESTLRKAIYDTSLAALEACFWLAVP